MHSNQLRFDEGCKSKCFARSRGKQSRNVSTGNCVQKTFVVPSIHVFLQYTEVQTAKGSVIKQKSRDYSLSATDNSS